MKKNIFLCLIIITTVLLFTSCGDSGGNADVTAKDNISGDEAAADRIGEETANPVFIEDDLGEFDFKGYEFTMWSRVMPYFHGTLNAEEETGDILNDVIYRRNRQIEDRFNFRFKEVTGNDDGGAKRTILAGDNTYDIINTRVPNAYSWAQEGIIHSVKALPHVNLDKPYWHQDLNKELSVANKIYFASGAFNVTAYDYTEALLFNKNLAKDLGIENLYTLVHEGKWTFAKFAEYCLMARSDLNGDGNITLDDQHGFISTSKMVMPSFWIAGGVKSIYKDENDIPYFAAMEPKFVDVYDKIIEYVRNNDAWFKAPEPNVQNDPVLVNLFKSGRALFFDNQFHTIKDLRDMEIDFGILPFPKLNEDQESYYTRLHWTELFCLPISKDEEALERTSVILEALACESAKYVVPAYYDISLKTKMSRDEESESMVDILFNTRVFDYGDTIWCGDIRDGRFTALFENGSTDLISTMERIQKTVTRNIDRLVATFEDLSY